MISTQHVGIGQLVAFQWALGLLLAVAAIAKMRHVPAVAKMLREMNIGSHRNARAIALFVIAVELVLGLALVAGAGPDLTTSAASLFLVCTGTAVARTVLVGKPVSCACFGDLTNQRMSWGVVARVAALSVIAISLWIDGNLFLITNLRQVDTSEIVTTATAAVAVAVSFYMLSVLEQIALLIGRVSNIGSVNRAKD